MTQNYEYIKLIGILAMVAGLIKLVMGIFGYQFGAHYLSSVIILIIGIVVFLLGLLIQKAQQRNED